MLSSSYASVNFYKLCNLYSSIEMNMLDLKACNTLFTVKVYIGDTKPCAANQAMLFLAHIS